MSGDGGGRQGHSALVKEAVYNSLLGCGAPFRLVPDHSRSGRLEASTGELSKWLCSAHFHHYLHVMQVPARRPPPAPALAYPTSTF